MSKKVKNKKIMVSVSLPCYAHVTVKLEVDDDMSDEEIIELAWKQGSLYDCEPIDWDNQTDPDIIRNTED